MSDTITKVRSPRVKYPAGVIRTREQILEALPAGVILRGDSVWTDCWNCGGRGTYPSSMIPAGMCRLYCWQGRPAELYGKLAKSVDAYVKQCQADDRAAYREELARPAREAAQAKWRAAEEVRLEAERAEYQRQQDDIAARKAASQWVSTPGAKIETRVTLVDFFSFEGQYGWRTQYRFRDDAGNVLVWWTGAAIDMAKGAQATIKGTVKDHGEYDGERQTTLLRVKVTK